MILILLLLLGGSDANYRRAIQKAQVKEHRAEAQNTGRIYRVSFYTEEYCRKFNPACITSCGERFSESDFTAACSDKYSCGDKLRVIYGDREVVVRCNDSGSFKEKYSRELDLSKGAFQKLSPLSAGVIKVKIEKL